MPLSKHRRGRSAARAARSGDLQRTNRRRKTNYWYLAASIIIAVLVIVSFGLTGILPGGGGGGTKTGSAEAFVEGVGELQQEPYTRDHVPGTETVEYSTTPPTSGDHWDTAAECGYYPDGVPDEQTTHNLEHGNIVVSHNLATDQEIEELRAAVDDIGLAKPWGILRYYPDISPGQVALATWGVLDAMEGVDPDRIKRFFETYAGVLGPEFIPCSVTQTAMPASSQR